MLFTALTGGRFGLGEGSWTAESIGLFPVMLRAPAWHPSNVLHVHRLAAFMGFELIAFNIAADRQGATCPSQCSIVVAQQCSDDVK
jgi:hypothetical protein